MSSIAEPDKSTISSLLNFANDAVDTAREIALKTFRNSREFTIKGDGTRVTNADLEIETAVRNLVTTNYPNHGFIGEEFEDLLTDSPWVWTLDPIDGTQAYSCGLPTFGILLGLTFQQQPVLGIIDMPGLDERWTGAKHFATTWQGRSCTTSSNNKLSDSIVFATTIDMFSKPHKRIFDAVTEAANERRFGIDCYAYGMLASGYIDVVMEANMKIADTMALIAIVEGSNGVISDWYGNPITLESDGTVLATANQDLHTECLNTIARFSS